MLGAANHLLAVARKLRWPGVLAEIAARLEAAAVPYKIVGGAAIALYGIQVPVKDIDIETTEAGAYRFQELFSDRAIQPVTLSDNGSHRSHFGRFDFDGLVVEVMGDVERMQEGKWLPTGNLTEGRLTLKGADGAGLLAGGRSSRLYPAGPPRSSQPVPA